MSKESSRGPGCWIIIVRVQTTPLLNEIDKALGELPVLFSGVFGIVNVLIEC